ncbi:acyl-CoA dehydrogenase family protein [Rhodococcus koreensis]|uniref:acyl-CoA dehydrogenase family protein n=1 Tax=Rhodococcus koreensis TaxID=99653 RepID=UPI0036724B42
MDFDISENQGLRLATVADIVEAAGGPAAETEQLDQKLEASDVLSDACVLDRFLVAEELARIGTSSTFGLRALLADCLPEGLPPGSIAVTEAHRRGPVRFANSASSIVVLDGDRTRLYESVADSVVPAETSFGFTYAHFRPKGEGIRLTEGAEDILRARWRLAMVAAIAGNARTAVEKTADHLVSRVQFGRPLSSLQALRHRLAEAAVSAEATRWLGREAAFSEDPRAIRRASWYASDTAATLVPDLMQMCGARSFTLEFGLHLFTMRMNSLRLEFGGIDRLGLELAEGNLPHAEHATSGSRL